MGSKIKTPAKFIVGDKDLAYGMPGMKEYIHNGRFKEDVPSLEQVVVMKGVSHFINMKNQKRLAATYMISFANSIEKINKNLVKVL